MAEDTENKRIGIHVISGQNEVDNALLLLKYALKICDGDEKRAYVCMYMSVECMEKAFDEMGIKYNMVRQRINSSIDK